MGIDGNRREKVGEIKEYLKSVRLSGSILFPVLKTERKASSETNEQVEPRRRNFFGARSN